jgi:AcrR family transcriptional regulator
MANDSGPRHRRADWARSREQILHAASHAFSRSGYRRTGTRDLAAAAGVSEATLFRHFPTKAQLFEDAVIRPFRASIAEIAQRRSDRPADVTQEAPLEAFYDEMLRRLRQDERLLIAGLAALTFEDDDTEFTSLRQAFSEVVDYLENNYRQQAEVRNLDTDPRLGSRILVGLAIGLALGDRLLFDDDDRTSDDELVAEAARITAWGLTGRPR